MRTLRTGYSTKKDWLFNKVIYTKAEDEKQALPITSLRACDIAKKSRARAQYHAFVCICCGRECAKIDDFTESPRII